MLNGYSPTFTSYNGGVYEMDLTRTAVNSFATHCSKLKPEIEGSALKSLEKTLQHKPNYFMDTTKFIKRLATYVAVEHTAFINTYRGRVRAALWLVSIESATLRSRRGSRAGVFTVSVCKWRAWSYRV